MRCNDLHGTMYIDADLQIVITDSDDNTYKPLQFERAAGCSKKAWKSSIVLVENEKPVSELFNTVDVPKQVPEVPDDWALPNEQGSKDLDDATARFTELVSSASAPALWRVDALRFAARRTAQDRRSYAPRRPTLANRTMEAPGFRKGRRHSSGKQLAPMRASGSNRCVTQILAFVDKDGYRGIETGSQCETFSWFRNRLIRLHPPTTDSFITLEDCPEEWNADYAGEANAGRVLREALYKTAGDQPAEIATDDPHAELDNNPVPTATGAQPDCHWLDCQCTKGEEKEWCGKRKSYEKKWPGHKEPPSLPELQTAMQELKRKKISLEEEQKQLEDQMQQRHHYNWLKTTYETRNFVWELEVLP